MQENKKDILKTAIRYTQSGDWLKVIKEYQKLLKMDPNDINIYNSLGDAFAKTGEPRKAFECYSRMLKHYKETGNIRKLPFLYKKISKLNPRKFDLEGKSLHEKISKIVDAVNFYNNDDFTRAFPALKEAVKQDPENVDLSVKLGEVAEKLMHIGDSVEAYIKALRIYIDTGDTSSALDTAKKILNIDKTNMEASAMIAEDLIRNNKKEDAENMYRDIFITLAEKNLITEGKNISKRAMDLSIKYGKQFYAYFLFKDGKETKAREVLESGYELTPEEKVLLGKIYYKTENFDKAKNVLLSLDPLLINKDSEILEQIGDIFLKLREDKKASEYYLKAVKLLKETGELDSAINMSHKVINVENENIELYEMLIEIYTRKNMKNPLIDTYEKLAKLYDKTGRTEDGLLAKQTLSRLKML